MSNIYGTEGDDVIRQESSTFPKAGQMLPIIYSLGGNDSVYVYRAIVEGGAGNNTYEALRISPEDFSILSYREKNTGVQIDLKTGLVKNAYGGTDQIKGYFPQIWGSGGDDTVILDSKAYGYAGMGGHDRLIGDLSGNSFVYVDSFDNWTFKQLSSTKVLLTHVKTGETVTTENIYQISQFTGEKKTILPPRKLNISIEDARSFVYCVWNGESSRDDLSSLVINSNFDVINLGSTTPINPNYLDPKGEKILIAHTNITQSGFWNGINLSGNPSAIPAWMGGNYQNCPTMYSVQYWNPAWKQFVFAQIDEAISNGYDGIFLDSCVPDDWLPSNQCGNTVYAKATEELVNLIVDINSHIKTQNLSRPFYLIPNLAIPTLIKQYPESIQLFSAVFNECLFFYANISKDNEFLAPLKLSNGTTIASDIAAIAQKYKIPFFGNDYFDQAALNLQNAQKTFECYVYLGAIPTIVNAQDPYKTIATGPYMAMANDAKPVVSGVANLVNFLSGGSARDASLLGGNLNDYLYGGTGKNTINGLAGNDLIYPHPKAFAVNTDLRVNVYATFTAGNSAPKLQVLINGVLTKTLAVDSSSYELVIDVHEIPKISSIVFKSPDTYWNNQNDRSTVFISSIIYKDLPIELSKGQLSSGGNYDSTAKIAYIGGSGGSISFDAAAVPTVPRQTLAHQANYIDGGAGINMAFYWSYFADYKIKLNANHSLTVSTEITAEGPDELINVQRLQFKDKLLAFDLQENAGIVAKILGAVFGKEAISNKSYVGIGLYFLDSGLSYDKLAALALDAAGAKTNDQIVTLLWKNVLGTTATAVEKAPFIAMLEKGMSPGELGHLAADTDINCVNINLVGLTQSGIEYIPI